MDTPDIVCLLILPSAIWASLIFVLVSPSKIAQQLRVSWNAKTKQELFRSSRVWTIHTVVTFTAVAAGLLAWLQDQQIVAIVQILNPRQWAHGVFEGIILGLVIIGIALTSRTHFPQAQRFSLVMLTGVGSTGPMRFGTLLLVVFIEELWRAVCLKSLIAHGLTGAQALAATSVAYGLAYLAWGTAIGLSECIVGAAFGGLFLWTNSLFVSFAAHFTLLGQVLLYSLAAAPDAEPRDLYHRRFAKCPSCGAMLTLQQVNLDPDESFSCPKCHARITVSDWRRGFFRWGYVFYTIGLYLAAMNIVQGAVRDETAQFLLSYALTFLALIGFWSFLRVLFPQKLKLETGDEHFVQLKLGETRNPSQKEESQSPHVKSKCP
jgi:hypothetical protein